MHPLPSLTSSANELTVGKLYAARMIFDYLKQRQAKRLQQVNTHKHTHSRHKQFVKMSSLFFFVLQNISTQIHTGCSRF